jgi:hypothetical protein
MHQLYEKNGYTKRGFLFWSKFDVVITKNEKNIKVILMITDILYNF